MRISTTVDLLGKSSPMRKRFLVLVLGSIVPRVTWPMQAVSGMEDFLIPSKGQKIVVSCQDRGCPLDPLTKQWITMEMAVFGSSKHRGICPVTCVRLPDSKMGTMSSSAVTVVTRGEFFPNEISKPVAQLTERYKRYL